MSIDVSVGFGSYFIDFYKNRNDGGFFPLENKSSQLPGFRSF